MRTLFVSLLLLVAASAFGQAIVTHENVRSEFDFQVTSCSGEVVPFIGEIHVVQHSTGTQNGGNFAVQINFHLEGTGASGTRYIINEHVTGIETSHDAHTFTSQARLVAVAQGDADNLLVNTFIHFTVSASGQVTAESFEFVTECQG